jgi:hypothetical protein
MLPFSKKDIFSICVLVLLIIGEFFALWGGAHDHYCDWMYVTFISAVLIILLLIWGYGSKVLEFEAFTFTNLLASAIAPRPLGVIYLLGFVMHLSWLTDGVLNYIVGDPWMMPFSVGALGILSLWLAFPDTKIVKNENKDVVLISGISKIKTEKATIQYQGGEKTVNMIDLRNMVPLVRFLNLVFVSNEISKEKVKKLLILSSDGNSMDKIREVYQSDKPADILMVDVTKAIGNDSKLVEPLERLANTHIITVRDLSVDNNRSVIPLSVQDNNMLIKLIIKITALLEFPDQFDFINALNIELTQQCDYDDFNECFYELRKAVEKEDKKKQLLYFNLTPGTGIVGALMSLFSIDNDRKLFFYAQFSKLNNSERLKPVGKDLIPLENLLSQALQKLKNPK